MLGPQDVGQRVVVRRIVGVRAGRPLYSDVLGELTHFDATDLVVRTRRGPVRVPLNEINAAKRVPDRPPDSASIAALERIASDAWPAAERDHLGEWELRATAGWTGRANSALPVGDPGMAPLVAIDEVSEWYRARGLPPRINVPLGTAASGGSGASGDPGVNHLLDEAGWSRAPLVLVQTARRTAILQAAPPDPDLPPVRLDSAPSPEWLEVVTARKSGLPPEAIDVLTARNARRPVEIAFASVYERDALLAVARGALVGDHLHLGLLEVVPDARRRGLARHITGALAAWASSARTVLLQVEEINQAAVALYARLGFRTHHTYLGRTAPVPA